MNTIEDIAMKEKMNTVESLIWNSLIWNTLPNSVLWNSPRGSPKSPLPL